MTHTFALLGHPVAHSTSPVMHSAAFRELGIDARYLVLDVIPEKLAESILGARALGFKGLNLTIPHKEAALSIVKTDELAKAIGAINTVELETMTGYNTDGIGFVRSMDTAGIELDGMDVLLLGAGGAARAISYALSQRGARLTISNRDVSRAEMLATGVPGASAHPLDGLDEISRDSDIVVNATSVGMHPDVESTLLTRDAFRPDQVVFDTIYNPQETMLLAEAKKAGAKTMNGISMLVHQGAESLRIWLNVEPPLEVMEEAVREALAVMPNKEDCTP